MHKLRSAAALLTLCFGIYGAKDDADEKRPYEFGFSIDGEQHRYEKKDINGIIQGEFGFITADGIYHVTVFATDENGNFRILRMRNIRISEPLDKGGKPIPGAYNAARQTRVGKQLSNEAPPPPQSATLAPKPTIGSFSIVPTIAVGCSGCGIVTKPTPILPKSSSESLQAKGNMRDTLPRFNSVTNGNGKDYKPYLQRGPSPISSKLPQQSLQREGKALDTFPRLNSNSTGNSKEDKSPSLSLGGPTQTPELFLGSPVPVHEQPTVKKDVSLLGNDKRNEDPPHRVPTKIDITDNFIRVPGNDPIPIQDRYPNMANGLPNGITEHDVSDILYKFNYTVGFHGHYESGFKNGAKIGGYFFNGRDGYSRVTTYVADENGYRPRFRLVYLGLDAEETPKPDSEKKFGLKSFEFVWYPIK